MPSQHEEHGMPGKSDPREALVAKTVGQVEKWMPTTSMGELDGMVSDLPREQQALVHEKMRHGWGVMEKAAAATLASILMTEELQANSAVTLWPINPATGVPYAGGALIPINTEVALQPVTLGTTTGPYLFVEGQRFFGLLTVTADTSAGWALVANTVKLSNDAISGLAYGDTSFGVFEQDVVAGRLITGEYERHEAYDQLEFFASAVLRAAAPAAMVGGLTVQLWDERCKRDFTGRGWNLWQDDYGSVLRDVIQVMHGGQLSRRLETLRLRRGR
jgi:hypothetical protein